MVAPNGVIMRTSGTRKTALPTSWQRTVLRGRIWPRIRKMTKTIPAIRNHVRYSMLSTGFDQYRWFVNLNSAGGSLRTRISKFPNVLVFTDNRST
jgi:hypothetical protein